LTVLGGAAAMAFVLVVVNWPGTELPMQAVPVPEPQAQQSVTQPSYSFTIQVAAYLKPEDAQSYVDRLKNQKIEAFWTKATGGNRTWYQVKVARFVTRDEARTYGEALKGKGVIDDFYVANYAP
jgi:cell division septation protein DedD